VSFIFVSKQAHNAARKVSRIAWIHQPRCLACRLDERRDVADDDARTTCHCFQRWETETFVKGRIDKNPTGGVKSAKIFVMKIIG
jgi:hypothetical protein